jgi:hypothetical protein
MCARIGQNRQRTAKNLLTAHSVLTSGTLRPSGTSRTTSAGSACRTGGAIVAGATLRTLDACSARRATLSATSGASRTLRPGVTRGATRTNGARNVLVLKLGPDLSREIGVSNRAIANVLPGERVVLHVLGRDELGSRSRAARGEYANSGESSDEL